MEPKISKRPFWKTSKRSPQESSTKSRTLEGKKLPSERETLRRIYLDDTSVDVTAPTKIIVQRRPRGNDCARREALSVCISAAIDGSSGDSSQQRIPEKSGSSNTVQEILVWYQSILYKATRRNGNVEAITEYLKDLYTALTSAKEAPSNTTALFQILDENRRQFRAIEPNDSLRNGTLLKLNVSPEHISPNQSHARTAAESTLTPTALDSLADINSEQRSIRTKRPSLLAVTNLPNVSAPLLPRRRNLCKAPSAVSSDFSSTSDSPKETSPEMLPTQISLNNLLSGSNRQPSTNTARGPPTALLPATVQVGPNGEKHLVIQYSDGQVFAAAFPQQGHLHFLPVSRALLPSTDASIPANSPASGAENSGDSGISGTLPLGTQESPETPRSQWTRPHQLSKAKLVCTCPPELHQVIRQSQLPEHPCELVHSTHTQRYSSPPSKDSPKEGGEALILPQSQQTTIPLQSSLSDAAALTTAGRWSTLDNFQESDSTDTTSGSGQVVFPIIRGGIPPDVLLTPGAAEKFRLATKPPQTLEEAQSRIALMEDQLAFLTSWVQAVQEQQGGQLKRSSESEDSPINRNSLLSKTSNEFACTHKEDFFAPGNSIFDSTHSPKNANSADSCCRNVDTTKYSLVPSPKTSKWIVQCGRSEAPLSPGGRWGLDNPKRTQLVQVYKRLREVKNELGSLQRTQESNIGILRNCSEDLFNEINRLLEKASHKKMSPLRAARLDLDNQISTYLTECNDVENWLRDLEACIEELRIDALQRRCRVSVSDVETYALHLSRLSSRLVAFKEEIPELKRATTTALLAEKRVVQLQEQFLEGEPKRLDAALSSCKQLTCTLFTLKRLGSVQEHGLSVSIPPLRTIRDPQPEDKQLFLQQIRNIIPDHEARILGLACHKTARLRRKRMLSLKDSLKFEQSVGDSRHNLDSILTRLGQVLLHQQALNPSSSYRSSGYGSEERADNAEASPHRMVRSVAAQTFTDLREDSTDGQPSSQHPEAAADQHRSCEREPDIIRCDCCEGPRGADTGAYRVLAQQTPSRGTRDAKRRSGSEEPQTDYSLSHQNPPFSAQEVFSPQVKSTAAISSGAAGGAPRRARVVFSRTVLVGDGRETTRLNCPSDLDEDEHTETSEVDEQSGCHPWRKEQMHRGNKVVDIHPGLPRNQYLTCGGQCGIQGGCTQTCCLARPRQTGSVLKSSLVSSSSSSSAAAAATAVEKSAPPAPPPRMSSSGSGSSSSTSEKQKDLLLCLSGSDAHHDHILPAETGIRGPIAEEDSDAIASAEGSGHHHHYHHHYCRMGSSSEEAQRKG